MVSGICQYMNDVSETLMAISVIQLIQFAKKKIRTWANQFQNLLNIPLANGVPIAPTAGALSCVSSRYSNDEILLALHKLKNNKAGGIDGLPPDKTFLLSCFAVVPHQYANRCRSLPNLVIPENPR